VESGVQSEAASLDNTIGYNISFCDSIESADISLDDFCHQASCMDDAADPTLLL
jgi:hypothetical protein